VLIVRHPKTAFNKGDDEHSRLKGTEYDLPITDEGRNDFLNKTIPTLLHFPIGSIRHSTMLRTEEPAKLLSQACGVKSVGDKRLDPWPVGYLGGMTRAAARARIEYYIKNPHKVIPGEYGAAYGPWFDSFEDLLAEEMKAAEKEKASPTFKARVLLTHSCDAAAVKSIIDQTGPQFHSEHSEEPGGVMKLEKKGGKWNVSDVDLGGESR
jgi:broad specificity phosphatase PhoE